MTIEIIKRPGLRAYPPRQSEFTKTFWDGLSQGKLLTSRCTDCGKFSFPPKPHCPHCWSKSVEWAELSGRGTLYSYTVVHAAPETFAADVPYRLCIVDLEEGLRVAAGLAGSAKAVMDGAVRPVVLLHEDGPLLAFTQDGVAP